MMDEFWREAWSSNRKKPIMEKKKSPSWLSHLAMETMPSLERKPQVQMEE